MKRTVQDYFTTLMQASERTDEGTADMPWEERRKSGMDLFEVQQARNSIATCQNEHRLAQMDDPCIFSDLVNHLAKGKAAGPDGVPNELLQVLQKTKQTKGSYQEALYCHVAGQPHA